MKQHNDRKLLKANSIFDLSDKNSWNKLKICKGMSFLNYEYLNKTYLTCFSYPESTRNLIYRYLFELSNSDYLKNVIECKQSDKPFIKLPKIERIILKLCLLNEKFQGIHYLRDYLAQFANHVKLEDYFLIELIIGFVTIFCNDWFTEYPLPPVVLVAKISQIVNAQLSSMLGLRTTILKLSIWRLHYSCYKDLFSSEQFLSFLDFCAANTHRPHLLKYFTSATFVIAVQECSLKYTEDDDLLHQILSNEKVKIVFQMKGLGIIKKIVKLCNTMYNIGESKQIITNSHQLFSLSGVDKLSKLDSLLPLNLLLKFDHFKAFLEDEGCNEGSFFRAKRDYYSEFYFSK